MQTKQLFIRSIILSAVLLCPAISQAHFQMLIPSDDIVCEKDSRKVELDIVFTHPMEQGPAMQMEEPVQFGVFFDGKKHDLKDTLIEKKVDGKTAFTSTYTIKSPSDYIFYIEPAAYWEPAEQKMIIHYTKVVVDAFGSEEGWDEMVGFPVEIEPLVRPYGLWTGNAFSGIVKKKGKPVPFAEIEVEYRNKGKKVKIPDDPYITQVIKADQNGVFHYVMPQAGWWSFAALVEGKALKNPEGKTVDTEWGGLIWVYTRDMK